MTIKDDLLALRDIAGVIRAEDGPAWAKAHPNSDLFRALNWDDASAADKYRVWQVRQLIAVHLVDVDGYRTTISLTGDRSKGGGYRAVDQVISSQRLREMALDDALNELARLENKYGHLEELAKVFDATHRVRDGRRRSRGEAQERTAA